MSRPDIFTIAYTDPGSSTHCRLPGPDAGAPLRGNGGLRRSHLRLRRSRTTYPLATILWEKAGENAWFAGNLENAFTFLSKAAGENALSQQGWIYLGEVYQSRGDVPAAMTAWERALPSAQAYGLLARAYRHKGDFPAAIADWQASLALEADNATAHYQLGLLLAATTPEDALPELMRAAELDPNLDTQVQSLRTALNIALLSEDHAYQSLISGRALGTLGEWDLAAAAFRNALAANPDYAEAWAWLERRSSNRVKMVKSKSNGRWLSIRTRP